MILAANRAMLLRAMLLRAMLLRAVLLRAIRAMLLRAIRAMLLRAIRAMLLRAASTNAFAAWAKLPQEAGAAASIQEARHSLASRFLASHLLAGRF